MKDTNLDAHIKVFKKTIRANGETMETDIINLFSFTLWDNISKMGQKFCTRLSQLHFGGVGINVLQMFLNCEERWKSLHAFEKPPTTSWWTNRGLLWMFVKTC